MKVSRNPAQTALLRSFNEWAEDLECVIVLGILKDGRPIIHNSEPLTQMQKAFLVKFIDAWELHGQLKGLKFE